MPTSISLALALAASVASSGARAADERSRDTTLDVPASGAATLEVHNVAGSVVAHETTAGTIVVHAHATANDGGDPAAVTVKSERDGSRVVVCVTRSDDGCADRHSTGRGDDVTVDLQIDVPRGVALDLNTVSGNLTALGFRGDVSAHDVSGNVRIATTGAGDAKTVNGSIDATIGTLRNDDDRSFETVNGRIHLTLPAHANVSVTAKTLNGSIDGDRDVPLALNRKELVGNSGSATFGNGAAHVSLRSLNGSIHLSAD